MYWCPTLKLSELNETPCSMNGKIRTWTLNPLYQVIVLAPPTVLGADPARHSDIGKAPATDS